MRLYLDTTVINDAFVLFQSVSRDNIHPRDFKLPSESWMLEYVALFYLLDHDDQWDLEFGTSSMMHQEIDGIPDRSSHHRRKKTWLLELYELIMTKSASVEMLPIPNSLRTSVTAILPTHKGKEGDVVHICQAILGGWDRFITTDRDSILNHADELRDVGIIVASPLSFLENQFMQIDMLVRTLHGSWTSSDGIVQSWIDQIRNMIHE
jgi:hypothetical protein